MLLLVVATESNASINTVLKEWLWQSSKIKCPSSSFSITKLLLLVTDKQLWCIHNMIFIFYRKKIQCLSLKPVSHAYQRCTLSLSYTPRPRKYHYCRVKRHLHKQTVTSQLVIHFVLGPDHHPGDPYESTAAISIQFWTHVAVFFTCYNGEQGHTCHRSTPNNNVWL